MAIEQIAHAFCNAAETEPVVSCRSGFSYNFQSMVDYYVVGDVVFPEHVGDLIYAQKELVKIYSDYV